MNEPQLNDIELDNIDNKAENPEIQYEMDQVDQLVKAYLK